MKSLKAVAPDTPAQVIDLDVPDKIGPDDLEGILTRLRAAVPQTVGRDPSVQRQERLIHVGVYRLVRAARDHMPEKPWDRQSAYEKKLEQITSDWLEASGKKGKVKVQKNTPLETRIARCVFSDRRRAHISSKVIRAAMAKGIGPDELLAFIEDSGGTEAIRRETSGTSSDDALDLMWQSTPLATIELPRELVGEQNGDLPKCILCTVRKTGEVDVRWIGDSASTARSALAAFAKKRAKSVVTHDASAHKVQAG